MQKIQVKLKENSYPILVGDKILSQLPQVLKKLKIGTDAVIITNALVNRLHGKALNTVLKKGGFTAKTFTVKDSETSKSVEVAIDLVEKIVSYAADKKPVIIAFGGGVIGDLAGFVAAILKRGVPFVQVPTTLLAQIDSSIGGKVAVDLPAGKNLIGAFYQPKVVLADVSLLKTLSARQVKNGLGEAIKYGVIKDAKLFFFMEQNAKALLKNDAKAMMYLVLSCATIKARIVELDEKETKGIRSILNFGHTVGHAIEAALGFETFYHGEAVALGMRAACDISMRLKLLKIEDAMRIENLISAFGLPETMGKVSLQKILKPMKFDKKFQGKKNRFVLAKGIGRVVLKDGVPLSVIEKAISNIIST